MHSAPLETPSRRPIPADDPTSDPQLCAAIVDRLTFGAIIETDTDSYRLAHTPAQPQPRGQVTSRFTNTPTPPTARPAPQFADKRRQEVRPNSRLAAATANPPRSNPVTGVGGSETWLLEARPRGVELGDGLKDGGVHRRAAGVTGVLDDRQLRIRPGLGEFPRGEQRTG